MAHAKELNKLSCHLNPDRLQYDNLAKRGALVIYTARDGEKLIGYMIYVLLNHLHYSVPTANQDILYLDPAFRKGMAGVKLVKLSERLLKEKYNVKLIIQHTKIHKALDPLFIRLGYEECDKIYRDRKSVV